MSNSKGWLNTDTKDMICKFTAEATYTLCSRINPHFRFCTVYFSSLNTTVHNDAILRENIFITICLHRHAMLPFSAYYWLESMQNPEYAHVVLVAPNSPIFL